MNWLSVAEIAKRTRIPAPTARRYAALFKDFLGGRKMGRVTKYPEESLGVFERISRLYADGGVTAEIEDALRTEFPRTFDVECRPGVPGMAQVGQGGQAAQTQVYAELAASFNGDHRPSAGGHPEAQDRLCPAGPQPEAHEGTACRA
jgi:hypothetical protein